LSKFAEIKLIWENSLNFTLKSSTIAVILEKDKCPRLKDKYKKGLGTEWN